MGARGMSTRPPPLVLAYDDEVGDDVTDSKVLVDKLWNYCNVLRDDGLSYGDYVEQLTYLLFLKMSEEQRHLAPLVTADVLSCWCPLDAPCHADTLCDLVGRLRSGDLVPGLVATPDVCGGALRIDGTRLKVDELARTVEWAAPDVSPLTTCDSFAVVAKVDPGLVRVAARVGGAL
jgi:hypothetical protein